MTMRRFGSPVSRQVFARKTIKPPEPAGSALNRERESVAVFTPTPSPINPLTQPLSLPFQSRLLFHIFLFKILELSSTSKKFISGCGLRQALEKQINLQVALTKQTNTFHEASCMWGPTQHRKPNCHAGSFRPGGARSGSFP